jgi:hemerythrin-like domain-containing protein
MTISQFMTDDHRRCDEVFADAEAAVDQGDWETAATVANEFLDAMEAHFRMEEEVLFPALENKTGMTDGPTQVMRQEHEQMRVLFNQMRLALEIQEEDDFLGTSETLLITMQQHNMKEEGIVYPMSDEQLAAETPELMEQMKGVT